MSAYGFDGAKNKVLVMTVEDFSDAVGEIVNPLLAAKQDQHITQSVTLLASGWGSQGNMKIQFVDVVGVTASNTVFVAPDPLTTSNYSEYVNCGVYATAQQSGKLVFLATQKPSIDIDVNVVILGVQS